MLLAVGASKTELPFIRFIIFAVEEPGGAETNAVDYAQRAHHIKLHESTVAYV